MAKQQSYKSHARYIPIYHFFAVPVLVINVAVQGTRLADDRSFDQIWNVVLALALAVFVFVARIMSLTAQNRVIRLEEKARLARLLPPGEHECIDKLAPRHLIGLRFASDEEAAELARRCAAGELKTTGEVKKEIRNWRPDYLRV